MRSTTTESGRVNLVLMDATVHQAAAAWDAVEELQAEASHQKDSEPHKTSLEQYCEDNPDAAECRLYDD